MSVQLRRAQQQANPSLSRKSKSRVPSIGGYPMERLVAGGLLLLLLLVGFGNIQLLLSSNTGNNKGGSESSSKSNVRSLRDELSTILPPHTAPAYPHTPGPNGQFLEDWHRWASSVLKGSYMYRDDSKAFVKGMSVHYPCAELQDFYHDKKITMSDGTDPLHIPITATTGNASGLGLRNRLTQAMALRKKKMLAAKNSYPNPQMTHGIQFPHPHAVLLTRKGNKFSASGVSANQDRSVLLSWPLTKDRQEPSDFWLGLFDGHGEMGHVVSQFASIEYPKRLLAAIAASQGVGNEKHNMDPKQIQDMLHTICTKLHKDLPNPLLGAGSTAISIWRHGHYLIFSNLGDSTAMVTRYDRQTDETQIIYETKPHKPDLPEERKRIESMGGEVMDPPAPGLTSRVIFSIHGGLEQLGLAMSRSLGDQEGTAFGVSSEPTTDVLDLTSTTSSVTFDPSDRYAYLVLAASDGLVDKVPTQEVAHYMSQAFAGKLKVTPLEAAEQLMLKSSMGWLMDGMGGQYRDDISMSAHQLFL